MTPKNAAQIRRDQETLRRSIEERMPAYPQEAQDDIRTLIEVIGALGAIGRQGLEMIEESVRDLTALTAETARALRAAEEGLYAWECGRTLGIQPGYTESELLQRLRREGFLE